MASNVTDIDTNKRLITTQGTGILCFNGQDVSAVVPCMHQQADTRCLLHLQDAVQQWYRKVSICTVDTDVVVLATASANRLNVSQLWIAFGAVKSFRFITAHEIAQAPASDGCVALSMFHIFTVWRQGQEDCTGNMDHLRRRHTGILSIGCHARPTCR